VRKPLVVGVAGDISPEELARRLDAVFGALPESGPDGVVPDVKPAAPGRLIVVPRSVPQSVVMFGQRGIARNDPDWYTAQVMMRVLGGGGLTSRLHEEVREKRGLAYSVYAYLRPYDHAALIMGGVATANARVAESLRIIRGEWRRMAEQGVTAEELEAVKTYINGSFPLRLDSTRRIAGMLVAMQVHRLGIDYLARRDGLINRVTVEDVKRVARRLLDPDALTVVVVGQPEGVNPVH
jgi:zinc protease